MTDGNDLQQIGDADDIGGLLGAYVLDALDEDERRRVEAYLAINPAARAEVDRLADSFDQVAAEEVEELAPPAALWDRIAGSLPPRPDRVPHGDADGIDVGIESAAGAAAPTTEPADDHVDGQADGQADELAARRSARTGWSTSTTTRIILSVAAAVIVVLVGLAVVRQSSTKTTSLAGQIQRDADDAAKAPDSKTATLTGESGASVNVVVDATGRGFIIPVNLPALPDGSTYQLWSVDDGTPVSLGILGPDPGVTVVATGDPSTMAITAEPEGGSPAPTTSIIVSGSFT